MEEECKSILENKSRQDNKYRQILSNQKWVYYFVKGYKDGASNGEFDIVREHWTHGQFVKRDWKEVSEREFSNLASREVFKKIECAGNVEISKFAYQEGRKFGIARFHEKGDVFK